MKKKKNSSLDLYLFFLKKRMDEWMELDGYCIQRHKPWKQNYCSLFKILLDDLATNPKRAYKKALSRTLLALVFKLCQSKGYETEELCKSEGVK